MGESGGDICLDVFMSMDFSIDVPGGICIPRFGKDRELLSVRDESSMQRN